MFGSFSAPRFFDEKPKSRSPGPLAAYTYEGHGRLSTTGGELSSTGGPRALLSSCRSSPAFSLYGRARDATRKSTNDSVGMLPSAVGPQPSSAKPTAPARSFGTRHSPARKQRGVGPLSYDVKHHRISKLPGVAAGFGSEARFGGDVAVRSQDPHPQPYEGANPGPGRYEGAFSESVEFAEGGHSSLEKLSTYPTQALGLSFSRATGKRFKYPDRAGCGVGGADAIENNPRDGTETGKGVAFSFGGRCVRREPMIPGPGAYHPKPSDWDGRRQLGRGGARPASLLVRSRFP